MKLIKIGALWCPACLIVNKQLKKINTDIEIINYDYDIDEEEVKKYNVGKTLPVLILLDKDVEVKRLIGEVSKEEIEEMIKEVIR